MSTLPGVALYRACGYLPAEPVEMHLRAGIDITFVPMHKTIANESRQ